MEVLGELLSINVPLANVLFDAGTSNPRLCSVTTNRGWKGFRGGDICVPITDSC